MKKIAIIGLVSILFISSSKALTVSGDSSELRKPNIPVSDKNQSTNEPTEPKEVSNFAAAPFKLGTASGQVPVNTRLRMIVQTPLTAEKSKIGDEFKAVVKEDFYLSGDFRKLIIPKNSWIRGKVTDVKRPRLLSRAGKQGVKLDTLVTPLGEYVPLDANLSFLPGVVNQNGLPDPQTGFGDKALEPTRALWESTTGKVVSVATAGVPVMGTLIGGSIMALFSEGDSAQLRQGQELRIVITKNTDLAI